MKFKKIDVFTLLQYGRIVGVYANENDALRKQVVVNANIDHPDDRAVIDQWDVEIQD